MASAPLSKEAVVDVNLFKEQSANQNLHEKSVVDVNLPKKQGAHQNSHEELVADFKRDYPELVKQAEEGEVEIEIANPEAAGLPPKEEEAKGEEAKEEKEEPAADAAKADA